MEQSHSSRVDVIYASGLASLDVAAVDTVVIVVAVVAVVVAFVCRDSCCYCLFWLPNNAIRICRVTEIALAPDNSARLTYYQQQNVGNNTNRPGKSPA